MQLKLDANASRTLAAIELTSPSVSRGQVAGDAFAALAAHRRFPVRLSREEESHIAALANGPFTAQSFRATGYADAFLAGVAIALATSRRLPRDRLLVLATKLAPDVVTVDGYRRWLEASPIRLARLFQLVDGARRSARATTTA